MKRIYTFLFISIVLFAGLNCGVYSFNDVGTIPPEIKNVKVNFIENRAPYVNPQLSPQLTESLKQKIIRQTKLTSTTNDNANFLISGEIRDYSVTTTGVTTANGRQQSSLNRLTVTVHIVRVDQVNNKTEEFDATRNFDYSSSQTLQQAERALLEDIIRNLTDEIFNRLFSKW